MDDETIGQVLDLAAQIKFSSILASDDDPNAEALYHDPVTLPESISIQQLEIFQQMMSAWVREGVGGYC